jgi:hypothetical protein
VKQRSFSPIDIVEQVLFEKLGNTKVRAWHYLILLGMLFIVPIFVPRDTFANGAYLGLFSVLIIIAWMGSRLVGRQVSKTSSVDSILIYRFFASVPWIFSTIFLTASLLTRASDDFERQFTVVLLCVSVLISSMHIIGIALHLKSLKKMIHNVKKDDLFQ